MEEETHKWYLKLPLCRFGSDESDLSISVLGVGDDVEQSVCLYMVLFVQIA